MDLQYPLLFPKSGSGNGIKSESFKGQRFPTYFRFHNRSDGECLEREAQLESSVRLRFDTDAEDEYFLRDSERGIMEVDIFDETDDRWHPLSDFALVGPKAGLVILTCDLPIEAKVGDILLARMRVTDPSRIDSFDLEAILTIAPKANRPSGSKSDPQDNNADRGKGNQPGNLAIPHIEPVSSRGLGEAWL